LAGETSATAACLALDNIRAIVGTAQPRPADKATLLQTCRQFAHPLGG